MEEYVWIIYPFELDSSLNIMLYIPDFKDGSFRFLLEFFFFFYLAGIEPVISESRGGPPTD